MTRRHHQIAFATCAISLFLAATSGCMSYRTPGGAVNLAGVTDTDIADAYKAEPLSPFPARLATARIQASNYRSYSSNGYGKGQFSLVTTRELDEETQANRLQKLPMVSAVAPLNRIFVSPDLQSDKPLRIAAAKLKADLLLLYTIDTAFRVNNHSYGPLELFTLGITPTREAEVTATASAAIVDVRSGYVYGTAEATEKKNRFATAWTSRDAVNRSRLAAEREAFASLTDEITTLWKDVVETYAGRPGGAGGSTAGTMTAGGR